MILEIAANVDMSPEMLERVRSGTMTAAEEGKLAIANYMAELFPEAVIYLESEPQSVELPAIFVSYFELTKQRKMIYTARYELGFEISYLPADALSKSERDHALWIMLQNITDVPGYAVQQAQSSMSEDGSVQITGVLVVWEKNNETGPIIEVASKEIENKPLIIEKTESEVRP